MYNQQLGFSFDDVVGAVKDIRKAAGLPAITIRNVSKEIPKLVMPRPIAPPSAQQAGLVDAAGNPINAAPLGGLLTPMNILLVGALGYAMMSSGKPRSRSRRRRR